MGTIERMRRRSAQGVRKKWMAAAAVIGLAATASSSGWAQSTKDAVCDPYKDYKCLDTYLGTGVLERFYNYWLLEWGHGTAPADPNAPSPNRQGWPRTPATVPPMAYTEWPTGVLAIATMSGLSSVPGRVTPMLVRAPVGHSV